MSLDFVEIYGFLIDPEKKETYANRNTLVCNAGKFPQL